MVYIQRLISLGQPCQSILSFFPLPPSPNHLSTLQTLPRSIHIPHNFQTANSTTNHHSHSISTPVLDHHAELPHAHTFTYQTLIYPTPKNNPKYRTNKKHIFSYHHIGDIIYAHQYTYFYAYPQTSKPSSKDSFHHVHYQNQDSKNGIHIQESQRYQWYHQKITRLPYNDNQK